ncbi:MAG: hypothetical protein ACYC4R_13305, partial [Anaerolineae bacterium]
LPLPPSPTRRHYVRAQVEVCLQLDGRLDVYYQDERIASYAHAPDVPVRVDHFTPATPLSYTPTEVPRSAAVPESRPRAEPKPAANHPWRRSPIGRQAQPPEGG